MPYMAMEFPKIANHGKAAVDGGKITFSYLDSTSSPVTETKPCLTPETILRLVDQRMERFNSSPPGSRESDRSRRERKYIAAQPVKVLRQTWEQADEHQKMELGMMLSDQSHHGTSDPAWLAKHAGNKREVFVDTKMPMDSMNFLNRSKNEYYTGQRAK